MAQTIFLFKIKQFEPYLSNIFWVLSTFMSRYDHYERLCWLLIQFYPIQKKIIRWKRNCFLITDSSKGDWFSTSTSLLPGRRLKKERRWRWKGVNLLKHYLLLQQILWLSISNSKSLRLLHLRQNGHWKLKTKYSTQTPKKHINYFFLFKRLSSLSVLLF